MSFQFYQSNLIFQISSMETNLTAYSGLQDLRISNNNIDSLPGNLTQYVPHLVSLDVSFNRLTNEGIGSNTFESKDFIGYPGSKSLRSS